MPSDRITIGKIVAPHGVRGEVRVLPLTDFPERFQSLHRVFLDDGRILRIAACRRHQKFILLRFEGYENLTVAEQLRGKLLQIERSEVVKLPEDHFYVFDIVGLAVFSETGELLGKVTDVIATGSNDVYVVEKPGKRLLLVPALKQVVKEVDLAAGRMTVKLMDEWEA